MSRSRALLLRQIHGGRRSFFPYTQAAALLTRSLATHPCVCYTKARIEVGGTLQVNCAKVNAATNICTSDNFEEIELKAWWKHSENTISPFNLNLENNHLCVSLEYDQVKDNLQTLGIIMPGRWCNLVLQAGKGDVMIQDMKEANTHVSTTGGNINLGAVRGNEAFFRSNGGSIIAELISGVLELRTDGGKLYLKKAIGTRMLVDTDGGEMSIGSVYGGDVKVTSGRGCIKIKHIQAQGMAIISSDGGSIKIDGLDGNAEISSNGGNIELQLLENAKEIKIDAGIGDVTLYGPGKNDTQLEYVKEKTSPRIQEPNHEAGATKKTRDGPRVLISSCGQLMRRERSWLDSVMKK